MPTKIVGETLDENSFIQLWSAIPNCSFQFDSVFEKWNFYVQDQNYHAAWPYGMHGQKCEPCWGNSRGQIQDWEQVKRKMRYDLNGM